MKSLKKMNYGFTAVLTVGGVLLLGLGSVARAEEPWEEGRPALIGTWRVTVRQMNCQTG